MSVKHGTNPFKLKQIPSNLMLRAASAASRCAQEAYQAARIAAESKRDLALRVDLDAYEDIERTADAQYHQAVAEAQSRYIAAEREERAKRDLAIKAANEGYVISDNIARRLQNAAMAAAWSTYAANKGTAGARAQRTTSMESAQRDYAAAQTYARSRRDAAIREAVKRYESSRQALEAAVAATNAQCRFSKKNWLAAAATKRDADIRSALQTETADMAPASSAFTDSRAARKAIWLRYKQTGDEGAAVDEFMSLIKP